MNNVFGFVSEETFAEKMDTQNRFLAALVTARNGSLYPSSWSEIQALVRAGIHSKVFSIGDQLICKRSSDELVWDIIGIDHDTPADPQFTHSLTLQLHNCYTESLQFDEREAFYYCETELPAGTYHFMIDSSYESSNNNYSSYQFTLSSPVPAGGQLTFPWGNNTKASSIEVSSYSSAESPTAIETAAVTEGTGGNSLGTLTTAGDFENNLNSIHRVRFGSNNYKESALRQWLNSAGEASSVWTPQTKFQRIPTWNSTLDGFMRGMDADFLKVIGKTRLVTARNTLNDGGGYDETEDYFFLPSRREVYMGDETGSVTEGEPYPHYSDYSELSAPGTKADRNRIKYRNGNPQDWWLRTPMTTNGDDVRNVYSTGAVGNHTASGRYGVAPACNII